MNALDAAATMLKSEAAALCSCHTTNGEDWGEDTPMCCGVLIDWKPAV